MNREINESTVPHKRKLLIVHEAMGGCGRNVIDIVNGADQSKFDITVLYGTNRIDDYYRHSIPTMSEHATLIPAPYLSRSLNPFTAIHATRQVRAVIKRLKPDILHCHSSIAGIVGRLASVGLHVGKVFYSPHAYAFQAWEFSKAKKKLFVLIERFFSRKLTTCTFNVSSGERDEALKHNIDKPDKFKVVYNGIPDIDLPSKTEARNLLGLKSLPENAIIVGSTVRLSLQKDPMTFVRIAQKVVKDNPLVHFVCVGDGNLRDETEQFVKDNGLSGNVHLLGYRDDAERIVSAFDIYLLTSLYEGLPYSLIEALRAGIPIAATNVTGNSEVVQPGVNGYLFAVGDVEGGAAKVQQIISERAEKSMFSPETIRDTYLSRFTSEQMLSSIQESYLQ